MSVDTDEVVSPRLRKRGGWKTAAIAVSLLIAAWAVVAVTPSDDDAQAPLFVDATVGERATARNLAITVNEIIATKAPTAGPWQMKAEDAVWVLVDLTAEATSTETLASL